MGGTVAGGRTNHKSEIGPRLAKRSHRLLPGGALNETGERSRIGGHSSRELFIKRRGAGRAPEHFINVYGGADAFEFLRGQSHTGGGQRGSIAPQVLVSRLPDKDAPPARGALQAAGEVHFT